MSLQKLVNVLDCNSNYLVFSDKKNPTYWNPAGQNSLKTSSGEYPSFQSGKSGWVDGEGMLMSKFAAIHVDT